MRAPTTEKRIRLRLEHLEERTVPTVVDLTHGTLTVLGSYGADRIDINQSNGVISVSGAAQTFNAADVKLISVDGSEGDDTITIAPSITATAWVFGGGGNDTITGGGGQNYLYGGGGNDAIAGGAGPNVIYGGTGINSVSGHAGDQVTAGSAYQTASPSAVAQQIVDLTNRFRAANGLPALAVSGQLTAAAALQSSNMVSMVPAVGYDAAMAHTLHGVAQPTLDSRAEAVGYSYSLFGENIAYGYTDAATVVNAWINSPGHRANMLHTGYTQIGVAVAYTASGMPYYTQEFGAPGAGNPSGPSPITQPVSNPTPTPRPTPVPISTPTPAPTPIPIKTPNSGPVPTPTPPVSKPPASGVVVSSGFGSGSAAAGQLYAVGNGSGSVTVYDMGSGAIRFQLQPYGTFRGEVRVAVADVTGDGRADIITAPGAGTAPVVKVFDGATGNEVRSFYAYDPRWGGGVFVAAGDVNGDGRADIVTGADAGGGPHVKAFDGQSLNVFRSFFAYGASFRGGVRVAVGDVDGDGKADIITAPGAGMSPVVHVFSGANGTQTATFNAYDPRWQGGVFVAAGDVNGDRRADIVTGADAGGGPHVRAFSGRDLSQLASFVTDANFAGGARVAVRDVNGDGRAEIIVAQGKGGRAVRLYSPNGVSVLANFLAGTPTTSGVYVG